MRREHHVGELPQVRHIAVADDIIHAALVVDAHLVCEHIHGERTDLLELDGARNSRHIDELTATHVDQHHAIAHLVDGLGVDHAAVLLRKRNM